MPAQPAALAAPRTNRAKGFESLDQEIRVDRLPVDGAIPEWLTGSLVRVTPAMLDVGGKPLRHWFDGIAMLNAFSFAGGRVGYGSRFLRTHAHAEARRGKLAMLGFAQDPCRALFKRYMTMFGRNPNDNANVNLARLGERFIAMTELPMPVEFDPQTLETVGVMRWEDRLPGTLSTAHPHFDRASGAMLSYVASFSARSSYRIFSVAPDARRRREIARIPVREPAYMHSFAITDRFVVLVEFPLVVDPRRLALSRKALIHNYRWEPERGTRFIVVERASGTVAGIHDGPPFFAFHHVNAFERRGELLIDVVVHEPGPVAIEALEVERLRGSGAPVRPTRPWRYRVPLRGGAVTGEPLAGVDVELPRTNYERANGREYDHFYACGIRDEGSDWLDQLVKVDVATGETRQWWEEGCYPGEPVFVPGPDASAEDDGVVVSVVLDARLQRSFLLILDGRSLGEVGRAAVPHHIPFGFHGQYFEADR